MFPKKAYEVDYNGWRIEGNVFDFEFNVYDGQWKVFSATRLKSTESYALDFTDSDNALTGLLLFIAIAAMNHPAD